MMVDLGDLAFGFAAIARRHHQVVHDRAAAGLDLETELDHAVGIRSGAIALSYAECTSLHPGLKCPWRVLSDE